MADDDVESGEQSAPSDRRNAYLVGGAALGLLVTGIAVAYFTGLLVPLFARLGGPAEIPRQIDIATALGPAPVYYDLPEMVVNLGNGDVRPSFLKLRVSLELNSERETTWIDSRMPLVVDSLHLYLRELRLDELKGSEGMRRMQRELLDRVTAVTLPVRVNAVLFKEMLVQ